MSTRLMCPRCDSQDVEPLPPDGISRWPGYACRRCGAALRAPKTTLLYVAVLVVCAGLLPLFLMPLWDDSVGLRWDQWPRVIWYLVAAVGVAVYSVWQLLRPTPRVMRDPAED